MDVLGPAASLLTGKTFLHVGLLAEAAIELDI
jgi:hypothetical protein